MKKSDKTYETLLFPRQKAMLVYNGKELKGSVSDMYDVIVVGGDMLELKLV